MTKKKAMKNRSRGQGNQGSMTKGSMITSVVVAFIFGFAITFFTTPEKEVKRPTPECDSLVSCEYPPSPY